MPTPRHTFFIAHAGPDSARARELRDRLAPDVSTFLDTVDLLAGDEWDLVLPRAQQEARATVVVVSGRVDSAYYLREEIAAAIAYQRADPAGHRLIPVYLDGLPAPHDVPYGLRVRHALDAARLGLEGVVEELRRVAAELEGRPVVLIPAAPAPSVPRLDLYEALCHLIDGQFTDVLFRIGAPTHELTPASAPRTDRARDLVMWAEGQGTARYDALVTLVRKAAPGRLP